MGWEEPGLPPSLSSNFPFKLKKTHIFSITVGNIILVSGVHRGKQTRGREFNGNTCAKMIMKSGDIKYY